MSALVNSCGVFGRETMMHESWVTPRACSLEIHRELRQYVRRNCEVFYAEDVNGKLKLIGQLADSLARVSALAKLSV